jgi:hypothetical protein
LIAAADSTRPRGDGTIRPMPFDLGDPARWRDTLPARQPASSEVAAGAFSGIVAGLLSWLSAMALMPGEPGPLWPLRLVAATFLGTSAVERDNVAAPAIVGVLLVGFASVAYGLVFVSILRPAAPLRRSLLVGAVFGAVLYFPAWHVVVHVFDPLLYEETEIHQAGVLALHVLYGTTLGFLVPFLRRILP